MGYQNLQQGGSASQQWDALTSSNKAQYIGVYLATWGLFQGASAVQLIRQHFGEGDGHCSYGLFFFLLWGSEAIYILLVIFVGYGANWDALRNAAQNDDIIAALLAMFAVTMIVMIMQFLYWVLCCGKNPRD